MSKGQQALYGRIPVTQVQPVVEGGRVPAKAIPGEDVRVTATAFREGHDRLGATAVLYGADGGELQRVRMAPGAPGTDSWTAWLRPPAEGLFTFEVEAWDDPYGTWHHAATVKIAAGVDTELMLAEGARLFSGAAEDPDPAWTAADVAIVQRAAAALADASASVEARLAAGASEELLEVLRRAPIRRFVSSSGRFPIEAERERAGRGAWYEFFPRSEGAVYDPVTGRYVSGTFRTAADRLDAVAAMGFDVVYLPPIHPIGRTHRKGRNNTLTAGPEDPGSPWAIGAPEGGHDAIHPDLGTAEDFAAFVDKATSLGLEVALDLALQASPDHPWVAKHPEWFTTQADGSIAYAENPPKKYQDIYPLNFDNDPRGLSREVLRVVKLWIKRGVRIFRVDNPHTKPLWFWEWLIAKVNKAHPGTVFLAEAFTRPAMMHALGRVGFQQSYSYFTWRNTKPELEEYFGEVSAESPAYFRPNFFVNTPDILTEYLQFGGPAAFKIRAVLAATASPLWGVYAGYELYEHVARPGAEEYIDNEKFEYKPRDFAAAEAQGRSLAPYLRRLNEIRRSHPALGALENLVLHSSTDDATVVYSKSRPRTPAGVLSAEYDAGAAPRGTGGGEAVDTVIVVVNTDPHGARESTVTLDLEALGLRPEDLDAEGRFTVDDLLTGESWQWGAHNYVRLDPHHEPAHVLHLRRNA
ncbi:alpha-1,4-glucan--maltose-1-phosphate maltosyltransferase [Zafaria sp. Z1313]|uniref:alpha-1,4-glucan--maltose-1-phosphate maltosyltransferase n=1 Tax=unclassified Zafaria TaxID=2828765 RepID=UPI002E77680D|nr:alpha-1,4-glucan--maltose-1-phosphate maltosyltransferase [Zafaria sp. J156]MEE1622021.1 alpha-1,4-glucan--maltose-1-phosphate maltosyltransferase [Zafaria sp. J156]